MFSFLKVFTQNNDVNSIGIEDFKKKLKTDTSLVVLDVRMLSELTGELGKISKAVNIPVQELESRISELNKYKNKNIAVICRSGNRSKQGTKILFKNGFKAVNVLGGMAAYRDSGNK